VELVPLEGQALRLLVAHRSTNSDRIANPVVVVV